jgi:hypothetical protein
MSYEKPEPVHILQPLKKAPSGKVVKGSNDVSETRVTCRKVTVNSQRKCRTSQHTTKFTVYLEICFML